MRYSAVDEDEYGPRGGSERDWRRPGGVFIVAELTGEVGARIREIQQRFDPKLAASLPPHVTIVGSSGVGPIEPGITPEALRERLLPIAATTPPAVVRFRPPMRFMQTDIVVLPLDPHGPLRELHERIRATGLRFQRARFTFTPHATLSFYRTLGADERRALLAIRISEPVTIDRISCSLTRDPLSPVHLFDLPLTGTPGAGGAASAGSPTTPA